MTADPFVEDNSLHIFRQKIATKGRGAGCSSTDARPVIFFIVTTIRKCKLFFIYFYFFLINYN